MVEALIPVIVFLLMLIVGTGLQVMQFHAVLRFPGALLGGTLMQILMLPAGAVAIIYLLNPPLDIAAGLLLISACPGGALSSFYCHFGRLNVALSVMLTSISSIIGFLALPLVLVVVFPIVFSVQETDVPVVGLIYRLFLLLLLPIGIGMLTKKSFPEQISQHGQLMRIVGLVLVVMLLGLIFYMQWRNAVVLLRDLVLVSLVFTLYALTAGWLTAYVLRQAREDRSVFAIEFAVRNAGVAAVVAITSLGRPEFVVFAALFVVVQFPLIMALIFKERLTMKWSSGNI
ncbi:bile acid:sodium symporter family protein [Thiolapillus brandeum]|uniref:Bile acid:sodium symporter, BASS family n=1 Tax=Thiolapillus brandeum TaxID=1076588 RepID=A0A7U6GJN2_9GAMM|nr:bile acid:sodium symporter [Thiolapillus brandeum]BAO44928.1 bile acid:sodium symporter, BASS family [Thiolapillus brandeum]